ncbi:hypothetical protein BC827DRAFT_1247683 [Russula dissimulans]|nr:hypothetical protein BC827DRAFT_1247683 [Russula dissimulans]
MMTETRKCAISRYTRKHLTFYVCPPHWTTAMAHLTRVLICWTLCALNDGEDRDEGCSDLTLSDLVLPYALYLL